MLKAALCQEIGQLKVELDWLKKKTLPGRPLSDALRSTRRIGR